MEDGLWLQSTKKDLLFVRGVGAWKEKFPDAVTIDLSSLATLLSAKPGLDFGNGGQGPERRDGLDGCRAKRVHMAVDEARNDGTSARIDHPGARPGESADLRVWSDRCDAAVADRNGLRDREPPIDGDHLAVDDDEVGRGLGGSRLRLRLRRRARERRGEADRCDQRGDSPGSAPDIGRSQRNGN